MKTVGANTIVIKVGSQNEQQETAKNSRKTLRVLQESADNKENLAGRTRIDKTAKLAGDKESSNPDHKRKKLVHKEVQTARADDNERPAITAEDLTGDEPSPEYWRLLAEKRQEALNDSLHENEKLKDHIDALEEENKICKEMLDESKHLIDVLQDMLGEGETSTDAAEEARDS